MQTTSHNFRRPGFAAKGRVRRIFVGENGIRAGWCALLLIAMYLVLSTLTATALGQFMKMESSGPLPPALVFVQEISESLALFVAVWIMARVEHRPFLSFGYSGARWVIRLVSGSIWGIFCLSTLVALLVRAHWLVLGGRSLNGVDSLKYGLAWACVALVVGIFEESLLRGYLQSTLARGMGFWWAALLLSVAFALWHISNGGESILGLVVVALGGLVFCLSLWYTRSLWWAIGFHAGWDWSQSYLYGTPDSGVITQGHLFASRPSGNPLWSGGSTGPEGSLLMLPMLMAMALGMWLWWGKTWTAEPPDK